MMIPAVLLAAALVQPTCFERPFVIERSVPNEYPCPAGVDVGDGAYGWKVCRNFYPGRRALDCARFDTDSPDTPNTVWMK